MVKPNIKTAVALPIVILTFITIVSYGTALTIEGITTQMSALTTETTQAPMTPMQAAYGITAALIALGVIAFMLIWEKANTITPETI